MGINRQSDPDEKNLTRITPLPMALLILKVLRSNADESGRVICAPTFAKFLITELEKLGYQASGYRFRFDSYNYNSAMPILYKNRLIVRESGKHSSKPAIFRVDLTSTYEQARELDLKLTRFLCSDISAQLATNPTPEDIAASQKVAALLAQLAQKDQLLGEQQQTIEASKEQIANLRVLIKDSLQWVDELAKKTRKHLREA